MGLLRNGLAVLLLICASAACAAATPSTVLVMRINGAIGPVASDHIAQGLGRADKEHAALAVIELDTPGGLDTSMRDIIRNILASPVPVAVYVTPGGARAASAGTYLLYAAHIAAMAPGTNVGAATPVQLGGGGDDKNKEMENKLTNDAVAYIRSLAKLRGRNEEWAEQAVRKAASIPADEALKLHVIDYMAPDLPALLKALDGKTIKTIAGERILALKDAEIVRPPQNWRYRLLAAITDPNVAYLLLIVGFYGLIFELTNPGFIFPGVAGVICILLALFAFQALPINYAGLALMLLGMALFAAEAILPSYGSLGIGGVVAFVFGSIFLMDELPKGYGVSLPLIVTAALLSAAVIFGVAAMAVRTRRQRIVSGAESLIGAKAVALEDFSTTGHVMAQGETWAARTTEAVRKDEELVVTALDGLTLIVGKKPIGTIQPEQEQRR